MSKVVGFEVAKLAKNAGFNDKHCEIGFLYDGTKSYDFGVDWLNNVAIGSPTQDDLIDWLEKKGMYIYIRPEFFIDGINWNWQVLWYLPKEEWISSDEFNVDEDSLPINHYYKIMSGTGVYGDNGEYPTRHDAIEAALKMGILKLNVFYKNNSIEGLAKLYQLNKNDILNLIRPFSQELGDWSFNELTLEQLNIIVDKLGSPVLQDKKN